jgi:hypothetical protein
MSITKEENLKIRYLMAVIEAMDGVSIPFSTGRKMFDVYSELKEFLEREDVVG